ncbi:MAG: hypothetical protein NC247_00525 [Ruminococcus flavefaciens]|nr:hypothetical protein [Ruminococcus flavefaciens]MCM1361068.1 hypothetical protein [Clostridiales bacterium]MCM1434594.1 hypothetical protein [Ruminococcus flavefaciens]
MKKLLAFLTAFTSAAALFVGCGKTDDSDDKKKSSDSSGYEEAVQDMVDAINNKDVNKIMELSMPDDAAGFVVDMLEITGNDMSEVLSEEFGKVKLISVEKTGDVDEETLMMLEKVFSILIDVEEYMDENDLNFEDLMELDESDLEDTPFAYLEDIESEEDLKKVESRFTITDCCLAEITLKDEDGEQESMEIPLYKVKGEGWNTDLIMYPAMIGYVKKSKQASLNSSANSLCKATMTALTDMDEEGCDVNGTFIISSDESLNYNVSRDFDVDMFKEKAEDYFDDITKIDYFVVISEGSCVYSACIQKENAEYIGTYPIQQRPSHFEYKSYLETESMDGSEYTLEELYDMAVDAIDNMDYDYIE